MDRLRDAELVYGVHPVGELLAARASEVERIWVARERGRALGSVLRRIVHDLIPLIGRGPGHKRNERLITDVEDFVGHAGLDVDEIAGFVDDFLRQSFAESVFDFALHDEEHHFETVMDVGIGDGAGRHGRHVDGQIG